MKKGLLIPLIVVATLALASLACLDTNYYGALPPEKPQVSAAQLEADRVSGEDFFGVIGVALTVVVGGFIYLSRLGQETGFLYGPIYWILTLGGFVAFAWGVLFFPVNVLYVVIGVVALLLSAPWALWGKNV